MAIDLVSAIKKAALDAVAESNPADVVIGKVKSVNPLKVQISPKLTLEKGQLIKTGTVDGHLTVGKTVLLMRCSGGQKYVIMDTVVS